MGYRSSVSIVVYGEAEIFDSYINAMKLIDHRVFIDWNGWGDNTFQWHEWDSGGRGIKLMHFSIDDVKWYDNYEAIIAWEKDFLPKAVDVGLNWELMRVGEESGDIDNQAGGENVEGLLYTSTSIETHF